MRIKWDEPANDGLSKISEGQRGAARDRVLQWANGAGAWNPHKQSMSFKVGLMDFRAEAEFTPPDNVTISKVEAS